MKNPAFIGLFVLSILLVIAILIFFFVFRQKRDDSATLYPKLTALIQNKSNWQRKQLPELDLSLALPEEFSFSTTNGMYLFTLNSSHPIQVKIAKNSDPEPSWVSKCKEQLPTDTSSDPTLYKVYCGQNAYLVQARGQVLRVEVEGYYTDQNSSEETQQRIRALVEEILGTIEITSW